MIVRKELADIDKSGKLTKQEFTIQSLKNFNWNDTMNELQEKVPTLVEVLKAAMSTQRKHMQELTQLFPNNTYMAAVSVHMHIIQSIMCSRNILPWTLLTPYHFTCNLLQVYHNTGRFISDINYWY